MVNNSGEIERRDYLSALEAFTAITACSVIHFSPAYIVFSRLIVQISGQFSTKIRATV
jgi:hypothetical protein